MDQRTCSIVDCDKEPKSRGWCAMHYARWRNNGSPEALRKKGPARREPAQCEEPNCDRRSVSRKKCHFHYCQWRAGVLAAEKCQAEDCISKAREGGFCGRHRSPRVTAERASGYKECSTCKAEKPLSDFHRDYRHPDRRVARCKKCTHAKSRDAAFIKRYGISTEEVESMRAAQGGSCATCSSSERLCVDHDHKTGAVRKLLCDRCNRALGVVDDDVALLRSLIEYLGSN